MKKTFTAYIDRNATLREMGFESYETYLRSKRWHRIRARVLSRDGRRCSICKDRATQVHHRQYDTATLSGRSLKELVSLCATCHDIGEFDSHGNKVSLATANQRLERVATYSTTRVATAIPRCKKCGTMYRGKWCGRCRRVANRKRLKRKVTN